jgi:hypothetical protein
MTESQFQSQLIKKLKKMFPGCEVMKMDAQYQQGFPDLLILWNDKWAVLEVKASATANTQPNQDFYIKRLDHMAFAAYIYPENEKEVLSALQQAFKSSRRARVLKP